MLRVLLVIFFILVFAVDNAMAHSGRTDASGGHTESKTGKYHKHTHEDLIETIPAIAPGLVFDDSGITWNFLVVTPENRCSEYDLDDYSYSQSVEDAIIERRGLYGHYENRMFTSKDSTDIEHIVAISEAHDSGLCAASKEIRKAFASDLMNLALASPELNRQEKSGKDAGEWMPRYHRKWFAMAEKINKQLDESTGADAGCLPMPTSEHRFF